MYIYITDWVLSMLGASSSYSDMAVSYEQWTPAPESTLSYYPSQPGSSYPAAYSLPMTSEYGTQQQVPGFGDTMSQTYVREIPSLCMVNRHVVCISYLYDGLTFMTWILLSRSARWQSQIPAWLRLGHFWVPVRWHSWVLVRRWMPPSWKRPGCCSAEWTTAEPLGRMKTETREFLWVNACAWLCGLHVFQYIC